MTQKEERDPAALTLELLQLMAEHPELRDALGVEVRAELPADAALSAGGELSDGEVSEAPPIPPRQSLDVAE